MAPLRSLEILPSVVSSRDSSEHAGVLNLTFTTTPYKNNNNNTSFFKQDLKRLGRIAIVTFMATITLLVVTVLLYEAVIADVNHDKAELPTQQKIDRVMTGVPSPEASHLNGTSLDVSEVSITTELPPTLPPALPRLLYRDLDYPMYRKPGRRKNYNRNKRPKPFRVRLAQNDMRDPYMYGEEYGDQYHSPSTHYQSSTNPKSVQEIVRYLTDPRPSKVMQNGVKFAGSFNNPTGSSGTDHHTYNNDYIHSSASNPLEDIRISGDPIEINSGLLGIKSPRHNTNYNRNAKPVPVSLMLDIYPMEEQKPNPPPPPSKPKRIKYKRRPSTSYSHFSSGYNSNEPYFYAKPATSSIETYHSPGQYYRPTSTYVSDDSSEHLYSTSNQHASSSLYHPSASGHLTRDHVAKPSYAHEVRRPFHGASQEDTSKGPGHQIKLHLNFYPKKKGRGSQLYDRAHNSQTPSPRLRLNDKYDAALKRQYPRVAFSTTSSSSKGFDGRTDNLESTHDLNADVHETPDKNHVELSNHRNHASSSASPLLSSSDTLTSQHAIVGSHGYTYEVPPRLFLDDTDREPRSEE